MMMMMMVMMMMMMTMTMAKFWANFRISCEVDRAEQTVNGCSSAHCTDIAASGMLFP